MENITTTAGLKNSIQLLKVELTATNCIKRGKIKEAERFKQSKILHAKREAEAIKLVNANVAQKCFYTFFCFNFRK